MILRTPEFLSVLSFFFQAEDGIRDWSVTGVQTCALPIFIRRSYHGRVRVAPLLGAWQRRHAKRLKPVAPQPWYTIYLIHARRQRAHRRESRRSEERRVGKECRCRWSPYE